MRIVQVHKRALYHRETTDWERRESTSSRRPKIPHTIRALVISLAPYKAEVSTGHRHCPRIIPPLVLLYKIQCLRTLSQPHYDRIRTFRITIRDRARLRRTMVSLTSRTL